MEDFIEKMYVIIDLKGNVIPLSINYGRKYCIENFLCDSGVSWKEAKKIGWQCKKVNVSIQQLKTKTNN